MTSQGRCLEAGQNIQGEGGRNIHGESLLGERQSIAQKGVRATDARNSQLENGSNAAKTSVRALELADLREVLPPSFGCASAFFWMRF